MPSAPTVSRRCSSEKLRAQDEGRQDRLLQPHSFQGAVATNRPMRSDRCSRGLQPATHAHSPYLQSNQITFSQGNSDPHERSGYQRADVLTFVVPIGKFDKLVVKLLRFSV